MTICEQCKKRQFCSSLCPEAELIVNQDHVNQREKTIGHPVFGIRLAEWYPQSNTYLTPRQKEIVTLFGRGLSRRDVCQLLEITRDTLRKHIQRIRDKSQK